METTISSLVGGYDERVERNSGLARGVVGFIYSCLGGEEYDAFVQAATLV